MKLIFELSGENETLPRAELECVGTVTDARPQVAIADCPEPSAAQRLAMTHVVLEYLGECDPDPGSFCTLLSDLSLVTDEPFAGRAKLIHAGNDHNPCSQREFERLIGTRVNGPVQLIDPPVEYRAILSGDRCYFGKVIYRIARGVYNERNPGKREFFHPGVMMPRMARTLVNLTLCGEGAMLLDPFCGTGGTLIEAQLLGMETIGSDFDPMMIGGCRENLVKGTLMLSDSTRLPVRDSSIDAIATDFPYGQSVCIRKEDTMENLYHGALDEMHRVLVPGHRAVVVTHRDIADLAARHMTVLQHHTQRVHKSLTRHILVLQR